MSIVIKDCFQNSSVHFYATSEQGEKKTDAADLPETTMLGTRIIVGESNGVKPASTLHASLSQIEQGIRFEPCTHVLSVTAFVRIESSFNE
jgi:hypothetical protein